MNKIVIIIVVIILLILLLGGGYWFLKSSSPKITWKKSEKGIIIGTDEKGVRRCYAPDKMNCEGWGGGLSTLDISKFNDETPALVCGADHAAKWGGTGFDDEGHWCNLNTVM
ncbi:MAG: hypothetical protein M0R33_15425 [Methylomonas sp.]|jgi:hypothetical protein|uniref:hypothetical protein n=1 Tax=Methylomonas sp. TaxID=418 RepID=UPI0025F4B442|nr:hypothetical protein [Methylomonas sp.]MCK9607833.1 hypothetical protein [Methylomonas sp.]